MNLSLGYLSKSSLQETISSVAKDIGFSDIKFISAKPLLESEERFLAWRDKGYAADMNYLLRDNPINARPTKLLEDAKTIIMLTANYYTPCPPRPSLNHGRIAAYAVGLDYHKVLRSKTLQLINHPELKSAFAKSRFFTDAVPLLEKSFAKEAGLGFSGKNTLLISQNGSFNFILEIITDLDLETNAEAPRVRSQEPGAPQTCGKCTRCIDICPTNALVDEYQLDSRLCISYHTIENRGEIPQELHTSFGEWLFGCDLCQTICPYNRKQNSQPAIFDEFKPESGFGHWLHLPEILDLNPKLCQNKSQLIEKLEKHKFISTDALPLLKKYIAKQDELDDEVFDIIFQTKFARTSLLRAKRKGLIRNASIVASNL